MNYWLFFLPIFFFSYIHGQHLSIARRARTSPLCDQKYTVEMMNVLRQLAGKMNASRHKLAQEYMIMVKQQQDLQLKIRDLEYRTFDVPTTARLRMPLQQYQRCRDLDNTSQTAR